MNKGIVKVKIFCELQYWKIFVARFVEKLALITNQDMLIVYGMQFESARYTSPVQNHLSQNVASRALRLTMTLHIVNWQYKSLLMRKFIANLKLVICFLEIIFFQNFAEKNVFNIKQINKFYLLWKLLIVKKIVSYSIIYIK